MKKIIFAIIITIFSIATIAIANNEIRKNNDHKKDWAVPQDVPTTSPSATSSPTPSIIPTVKGENMENRETTETLVDCNFKELDGTLFRTAKVSQETCDRELAKWYEVLVNEEKKVNNSTPSNLYVPAYSFKPYVPEIISCELSYGTFNVTRSQCTTKQNEEASRKLQEESAAKQAEIDKQKAEMLLNATKVTPKKAPPLTAPKHCVYQGSVSYCY